MRPRTVGCIVGLAAGTGLALVVTLARVMGPAPPTPNPPVGPPAPPDRPLLTELTGPPWFRDVTAESGVAFTHRTGADADEFTILESLGGGVALLDYDGDGRLDLYFPGGGSLAGRAFHPQPGRLYRNLGGWKFADVTAAVGLDFPDGRAPFHAHGVAVADFDRDGWDDLLVTGYGRLALYHNQPDGRPGKLGSARRFVDVTDRLGLAPAVREGAVFWATSAAFADLDGDGWPDLYVCHYVDWSWANHPACPGRVPGVPRDVCAPQQFRPLPHAVYRNEQGKRFQDVSRAWGLAEPAPGLGVVAADLDDDGRPDLYVANDAARNFLYLNRPGPSGWGDGRARLDEAGESAGVARDDTGKVNGSMGVDVGDDAGTGRPSLWVTNFQGELHGLYRNLGQNIFQHQSRPAGVAGLGQHLVGFGTAFVDVDGDGWEDLVAVHGHVLRHPPLGSTVAQRPALLWNVAYRGRRFFQDAGARGGAFFQTPARGRGLAVGDLDDDGRPDLVVSHADGPAALLRNVSGPSGWGDGAAPGWLGVRLAGRGRRDVVGSTVILETGTRRLTRFVRGGGSYLSSSDPRLLFRLGDDPGPFRVSVRWSWGTTQTWDDVRPGGYRTLSEGEAGVR